MKLLELIRADRRIVLLILTSLLAFLLGFIVLPPDTALAVITAGMGGHSTLWPRRTGRGPVGGRSFPRASWR